MKYTIEKLMTSVGCEKFPTRWCEIFDSAMEEYDTHGSIYSTEQYYEKTNKKYRILDGIIEVYTSAAREIRDNEELDRLLFLLCFALRDRSFAHSDLKCFTPPKAESEDCSLPYNMLTALAMISLADHCYSILEKRGIPEEFKNQVMQHLSSPIRYCIENNRPPVYSLFEWNQYYADARIFRIGRLEFHFGESFGGAVNIFENSRGEKIALANGVTVDKHGYALGAYGHEDADDSFTALVTEDDQYYEGHRYTGRGYVESNTISLKKSEWTCIVTRETPALKLHIPRGDRLTPEAVDESLRLGMEFAEKYFPDFDYKVFSCYSWLCDPQLSDILNNDSNIVKFSKRFSPLAIPSKGRSVFNFVYRLPENKIDYNTLPDSTSLERALKNHYLSGKVIYEMRGYFFK